MRRRNLVLSQMHKYGYLTASESDSLQQMPLRLNFSPLNHNVGIATHFREHLRLELKRILSDFRKPNGMAYNIYTDGLKIYTTLDANMQAYAENAVQEHMPQLQQDFIEHLGDEPAWENDTVLIMAIRQSPRYRQLRAAGVSRERIDSIFNTPVEMTVFDWKEGEATRKMSPLDSIKYYLSMLNAGFMAVEPQTGSVKAWVGGIEHKYFKYDHVTSRRQVGSTFKPIVYATAINRGIPPCSYTGNYLRTYPQYQYWTPKNADNRYGGLYSMEGALINSVNTISVRMALRAGPIYIAKMAEDLGISGDVPGVPAIALGAHESSLKDMVTVYSTFANRGKRPELRYIQRIETARGRVIYQNWIDRNAWAQPLTTDQADMINEMLQSAVDNGTGRRLRYRYKFTNEIAGKTGTSQNHSDGWFIGYTPTLVAGTWVGGESPSVRFRDLSLGQGANMALPVYALFLKQLQADKNYEHLFTATFAEPAEEVVDALNCARIKSAKSAEDESDEEKTKDNSAVAAAGAVNTGEVGAH